MTPPAFIRRDGDYSEGACEKHRRYLGARPTLFDLIDTPEKREAWRKGCSHLLVIFEEMTRRRIIEGREIVDTFIMVNNENDISRFISQLQAENGLSPEQAWFIFVHWLFVRRGQPLETRVDQFLRYFLSDTPEKVKADAMFYLDRSLLWIILK